MLFIVLFVILWCLYAGACPPGLHLGTTTPGRTAYVLLTVRFKQGKNLSNKYKSNFKPKQQNNDED